MRSCEPHSGGDGGTRLELPLCHVKRPLAPLATLVQAGTQWACGTAWNVPTKESFRSALSGICCFNIKIFIKRSNITVHGLPICKRGFTFAPDARPVQHRARKERYVESGLPNCWSPQDRLWGLHRPESIKFPAACRRRASLCTDVIIPSTVHTQHMAHTQGSSNTWCLFKCPQSKTLR